MLLLEYTQGNSFFLLIYRNSLYMLYVNSLSHTMFTFWQSITCLFLLFWVLLNNTAQNLTPSEGVTLRRWEMGPIFYSRLVQKVRGLKQPWNLIAQQAQSVYSAQVLLDWGPQLDLGLGGTDSWLSCSPTTLGTEACFSSVPTWSKEEQVLYSSGFWPLMG